jgi:hypothetical protein
MSSATAGWIFEATVNQLFTHGQQSDQPIPKPIRMTSDGLGILTFTTPHHPSTDDPQKSLRSTAKTLIEVEFVPNAKLFNVTFDNNNYVPATTNNPSFDSLTIDHEQGQTAAVVCIFQTTVSSRHEASADIYPNIRKIVIRTKELLGHDVEGEENEEGKEAVKPIVEVRHFLVCPGSARQNQWEMAKEWDENYDIRTSTVDPPFVCPFPLGVVRTCPTPFFLYALLMFSLTRPSSQPVPPCPSFATVQ